MTYIYIIEDGKKLNIQKIFFPPTIQIVIIKEVFVLQKKIIIKQKLLFFL